MDRERREHQERMDREMEERRKRDEEIEQLREVSIDRHLMEKDRMGKSSDVFILHCITFWENIVLQE